MKKELYQSLRSKLDFGFKPWHLLSQLCIDAVLIGVIIALFQSEGFLAYAAALPIAALMIRNVSLMHEAVHGLAHPNSKINYLLGLISGSLCLLPFHLWKKIHLEHHFWAGNFNRDPALEIMKRYPHISALQKAVLSFSWKTRLPLTAFFQYVVFWGHSAVGLMKNSKDGLLWLNMIFPVGIWAVLMTLMQVHQLAVLAAGTAVYLMLFEYINLPHHVGLYLEDSQSARVPVWQQYEVTRSERYFGALEKLLVLNFNYHAEHHVFPDLPWHELPKAHLLIQSSEAAAQTTVVRGDWLRQKRKEPFIAFLRPDVHAQQAGLPRVKPAAASDKIDKKAA